MRRCTRNYLEGILKLYPEYVNMIQDREQELLHPNEVYIDQNTGGGRSSFVGRPTEQKAVVILSDKDLEIIKGHKRAIETTLYKSDDITKGIIEAHYFNDTKLDSIAQDLETTFDFCNKLRKRYLDTLATELRLLK